MKINLYRIIQKLTLFSVLVGFAFLMSCEDEDADTSKIELKSFGPSGVQHGEMIQIIGANLDKVTSIVFANGVEVTAGEFQSKSPKRIEVIVPDEAEAGKITLKTPQGDIVSKSIISFDVPVIINSITSEAKPGTNITITGEFLNWIETVTFTSDLLVESDDFVSQSQGELVLTVPLEAQSGLLLFTSGGTEPMSFSSDEELVVTLPVVSSISPESIVHESDLTISGTDLDLITEVVFNEGISVLAENFVGQSETEIVVTVPVPTETGTITLKQMSPVDVVTTQELSIILPVGISVAPVPAVPGQDNITITGTDLDLVGSLTLPPDLVIESSSFVSQSGTEIVVAVPADVSQGGISYETIHGYSNTLGVALVLPGAGPAPLLVPVYEDALEPTVGEGGGWNAITDFTSNENPRTGSNSVKVTYSGAWGGGAQFGTWGKPDLDVSTSEVFIFSVYGGAGTNGAGLNIGLNGNAAVGVTISEGEWLDFEIPLADWGGITAITEIWFQDQGFSGDIYIDHIGFGLPSGPQPLTIIAYDDVVSDLMGQGGGWGGATSDFASIENVREGSNAIKVTFAGDWAGAAQLGTWGKDNLSIAGMTVFAFSVYGGPGTDGFELNANIKLDADNPQIVTLKEGEWIDVEIPIADFGALTEISEIWFQDTGWVGDVYIDYIGFR